MSRTVGRETPASVPKAWHRILSAESPIRVRALRPPPHPLARARGSYLGPQRAPDPPKRLDPEAGSPG